MLGNKAYNELLKPYTDKVKVNTDVCAKYSMATVPMILGFVLGKYVFKLSIFNNLGSITGGMTSTPALGTLIAVTKTEAVAVSYAATYPLALIMVVLACEFIPILF